MSVAALAGFIDAAEETWLCEVALVGDPTSTIGKRALRGRFRLRKRISKVPLHAQSTCTLEPKRRTAFCIARNERKFEREAHVARFMMVPCWCLARNHIVGATARRRRRASRCWLRLKLYVPLRQIALAPAGTPLLEYAGGCTCAPKTFV